MAVLVASTTTTQPATASQSATSAHTSSSVSPGAIAGIIIGTALGGSLLIVLLLNLLKRYRRHKFTRVSNPAHDPQGTPQIMSTTFMGSKYPFRHGKSPSTLTEPLISPASWPPLPLQSPTIPPPSRIGESHFSLSFGLHTSGSVSSLTPSIPPLRTYFQPSSESLWLASGGTPPRQASSDSASPSTSPKPQQTLFLHRVLQSRARASEVASPSPPPSLDISLSRSSTLNTTVIRADVERLIAEAERDAVRDAERAEKEEGEVVPTQKEEEEEEEWDEVDTESIYSQNSAPLDHAAFFSDAVSRRSNSLTVPRRKSTRRRARTPAPGTEVPLTPVAEMPDTPRTCEEDGTLPALAAAKPDEQVSNMTPSGPISSAVDGPGGFPLLTSTNFGKGSTSSGTISSAAGWGSSSNGTTSRYPSLATSSILGSSRSGQHADGNTEWLNPPSGLAGLNSLSIEPLHNPHSPVGEQQRSSAPARLAGLKSLSIEPLPNPHGPVGEQPEPREGSSAPARTAEPAPARQRARLRDGTNSTIPEVERRDVTQGGIAHIDVTL